MKVGFGVADISPEHGITLSGFIARQNKPSERFADPLHVRCLAIEDNGIVHLLFSYDLLGIGVELLDDLTKDLTAQLGGRFSPQRAVFSSTHNHSAPATLPLEGCGIIEPKYWELVRTATVRVAREAMSGLRPSELHAMQCQIKGLTYNRRKVLENGKVGMAHSPAMKVISAGPVDDLLTLLAWYDAKGVCIAGAVHFASHPVINGSQVGTADHPGQICSHVSKMLGAPCFFLQGASGDINPNYIAVTHKEVVEYGQQVADQLVGCTEELRPIETPRLASSHFMLPLEYDCALDIEKLSREADQLEIVSRWQPGATSARDALETLANIMNCRPDEITDPAKHAFNAAALVRTTRRSVEAIRHGSLPTCPLSLGVWDLGGVAFCFLGAEVFAETGLFIRQLAEDHLVLPVGCCGPLIGYLPTRQATKQGGYETDYAWRYFGHPAPFKADSEERVRAKLDSLLSSIV